MYAVIATGGKQYRVSEGETIEVERLGEPGTKVELTPVLVVDGDKVLATPAELGKAKVTATVKEEIRGPKIVGFTYKNKSNQRRRWGHRQNLAVLEIDKINVTGAKKPAAKKPAAKKPAAKKPAAEEEE